MDNVYLWVSKQSRKIVMTADLEENLIIIGDVSSTGEHLTIPST